MSRWTRKSAFFLSRRERSAAQVHLPAGAVDGRVDAAANCSEVWSTGIWFAVMIVTAPSRAAVRARTPLAWLPTVQA